ncbi:hypothetical protein [Cryobacterium sp. Hb1]|uniref:hypothetical protein n=1 Tax=Cryobacterium sp. Hb1 TaxID=1259147 RepID=UPI001069619C|nr:hypothetical protein [Cryobacterium sp. Hb1]TFD69307.1 hypothetical protein E3T38_09080 [Cryobacterium sp. Hb1]
MLFVAAGTLAINAGFGLNRTLGSLFDITTESAIALPAVSGAKEGGPLYKRWVAPAGLPVKGTTGSQIIPNTVSGFTSRPAGIYLPPAALISDAPTLADVSHGD